MTILLVSHSMEDVAEYVDRIIVMNRGVSCTMMSPDRCSAIIRNWRKWGLRLPR